MMKTFIYSCGIVIGIVVIPFVVYGLLLLFAVFGMALIKGNIAYAIGSGIPIFLLLMGVVHILLKIKAKVAAFLEKK